MVVERTGLVVLDWKSETDPHGNKRGGGSIERRTAVQNFGGQHDASGGKPDECLTVAKPNARASTAGPARQDTEDEERKTMSGRR